MTTGALGGSGTTAPVYFQMKSTEGEKSLKKRLVHKGSLDKKTKQMRFAPGSRIAFKLRNRELGQIHSIKIDIDQVSEIHVL